MYRYDLLDGKIGIFVAGPFQTVQAYIPKGPKRRVRESTGIEEGSWNARLSLCLLSRDKIGPLLPIGVSEVSVSIGDRKPIAGRQADDARQIPVSNQSVYQLAA